MPKTKARIETPQKAPATTLQKQPDKPDRQAGRSHVARMTTTPALPPSNGQPSGPRAASALESPGQGPGAAGRARMVGAMQRSMGNARLSRMMGTTVQAKRTVGAPNDVYEQQADRVAERVMRMPEGGGEPEDWKARGARLEGGPLRGPDVQRRVEEPCADCDRQVRRRGGDREADTPPVTPEVESYLDRSRGGGQPLAKADRAFMETRFGQDLGGVRVHTGREAGQVARELNAQAFTTGQDIYIDSGRYRQGTPEGRRLLAHELTHVQQQSANAPGSSIGRVTHPRIQRGFFSALGEAAEWAGGKIASGAEAAWEGAQWAGGQAAAGARWAGGKVVAGARWAGGEARRVAGAAWECAKASGRSIASIVTLDVDSAYDLLGIPAPTGENAPGILAHITTVLRHPCLQMIPGYTLLAGVVRKLSGLQRFLEGAWRIMEDPGIVIDAIQGALGGLIAQIPARVAQLVRNAITFSDPPPDHLNGIWRHLGPKLEYLAGNWWQVIKDTAWDLLWPWEGAWKNLGEIWDHIRAAGSAIWDLEFSDAIDELNAVWRKANELVGRLYGWIFLASVLIGAIIGAFFGGAGALPGAAAGAKFALALGEVLLISTIAAETSSLAKAGYDLIFTEQTEDEREADYEQIANSGITLAITGIMFGLGALAVRFARGVINRVAALVWRRPALRGRGTTSRGDVIEVRVATAAQVLGILRRRAVTWLETIRRNFPVIDLLEGGQITITPRPRRAPLYRVTGGRLISVKSTGLAGADAQAAIQGWIDDLANFTTVRNVTVTNPSGRTLMVAVQQTLDDAALAALRSYASGRGVRLEIFRNLPPNHPALIFPDAIPAVMTEAGVVASSRVTGTDEPESAQAGAEQE